MKEVMIKAATAAGSILMEGYGKHIHIESKDEKGWVTEVDKKAENKILSILLKDYNFNVLAEESGVVDNNSEYCWVIDPLDGTTNFIKQIPFFCVSIALVKNNKPELAVIYQPFFNELFFAERGRGAYLNGNKLNKTDTDNKIVIDCNLGYGQEARQVYPRVLNRILDAYPNIRNLGSSALELAFLSANRIDCFITYGDEYYDVAAGILIAEESGCKISNWKGELWSPEDKDLLAAPPSLHKAITNMNLLDSRI